MLIEFFESSSKTTVRLSEMFYQLVGGWKCSLSSSGAPPGHFCSKDF
jgi:hypothetical protein